MLVLSVLFLSVSYLPNLFQVVDVNTKSTKIGLWVPVCWRVLCVSIYTQTHTHSIYKNDLGTSFVVQRLKIHLPIKHGFNPWSGKIPHATEQISRCSTT